MWERNIIIKHLHAENMFSNIYKVRLPTAQNITN